MIKIGTTYFRASKLIKTAYWEEKVEFAVFKM